MKYKHTLKIGFSALALASMISHVGAEDIDLYVSGNQQLNAPNVLFFIDNSSNWSAANQAWAKNDVNTKCGTDTVCQGYVTQIFGNENSLKQGQIEMRALKLVINELVCGTGSTLNINVGIMMYNTAGTMDSNSGVSGYIRHHIQNLDADYCSTLTSDLENIATNINDNDFKGPSSTDYGSSLYEAYKYFGGYTNPQNANTDVGGTPTDSTHFGPIRYSKSTSLEDASAFTTSGKTTYKSPIDEDNLCGKNYIVLIGNKFPNQEYGTNPNATPPTNTVLSRLGYNPSQLYSVSNKSNIRFADEWVQFLATTDVSSQLGQQPIFTYTLDVYNTSPDADQEKLLRSMAENGGTGTSGYYKIGGNLKDMIDAFKDIFTQIAAVNSVFASASLPVSVNTQGTYLNQIFIGMFRPDSNARPRWAGNLKQYKFAVVGSGSTAALSMVDKFNQEAIDNANTGFIKACATSFWTSDSGSYWERVPEAQTPITSCATPPTGTSSVYSDMPDGNIVEHGGAAQYIRSLTTDTRNIKTCASVSACTTNAGIENLPTTAYGGLTNTMTQWIRGHNVGDGPVDTDGNYSFYQVNGVTPAPNLMRPTVHGDVIHSRPLAINYGSTADADGNFIDDVVVFYGSGDGLLRAVDGNQTTTDGGKELWAFLAPEFFSKISRLRDNTPKVSFPTVPESDNPEPKDYFFDGPISAYQERNANKSIAKLYLYAAMRRGGRTIYAFNATNRPSSSSAPSILWKFGCPNAGNNTDCTGGGNVSKLGFTWSSPRYVKLKSDSVGYLVFGGGYDTCEDNESTLCSNSTLGQGIFVLNAETGAQVAYIDLETVASAASKVAGRVIADVMPVDTNNDGYPDVMYAVDTRGNLWRTNISRFGVDANNAAITYDGEGLAPSSWQSKTYLLASVSDWSSYGTQSRKFMYSPDVVNVGTYNMVLLGSGDREQPLSTSKAAKVLNRFYGFKDVHQSTPTSVINAVDCDAKGDLTIDTGCSLLNTTDTTLNYGNSITSTEFKGWYVELEAATACEDSVCPPTEQVITTPVTTGGYTYFSTFQATDPSDASNSCSNLGQGRGYALNFLDGSLRDGDTQRSAEFVGGGIPPSPVTGVVDIDGKKYPFIIGGRPKDSGGSALDPSKVKINIISKRKSIYKYQKIDK